MNSVTFFEDFKQRLESVEWDKLQDAYGSSEDTPLYILDLIDDDKTVREEAYDELYGSLCHQGTIYQATGFAVPFLIELLDNQQIKDKDSIFFFLGTIHEGIHETRHIKIDATKEVEKGLTSMINYLKSLNEYETAKLRYDFYEVYDLSYEEEDEMPTSFVNWLKQSEEFKQFFNLKPKKPKKTVIQKIKNILE